MCALHPSKDLQDIASLSEERGMPRQRRQLPADDPAVPKRRPHRLPWWIALLVLASACSRADEAASSPSMPSRTTAPSSGWVAPSQHVNFQMRQVMKIVSPSSADWSKTRLTCSAQGEALSDCVASTLDAARIVLLRPEPGGEKYVLGPVIVDGTDVERATAQLVQQPDFWSISIELTAEAAEAFKAATQVAARSLDPQNQIAIILDGRIVSSPIVSGPIPNGNLIITGGFTETEAKALASSLIGSG